MSQDQDQSPKRVCLGKITSAHGVRGLVKIFPFGEDPSLIETLGPCYTSESGSETLTIHLKNPMGNKVYLAEVEGIASREDVATVKGTKLFVDKDKLPEIEDDGTFYYEDLVGLKAVNEDGKELGKVIAVENFGAGELLEVRLKSGQDVLIPFTDEYVPEVSDVVTIRNYEVLLV